MPIAQVIALACNRDERQGCLPAGTSYDHQMVHACDVFEVHGLSIAKRAIKIVWEAAEILLAIFRYSYMIPAGRVLLVSF